MHALIVSANDFEDSELLVPLYRLQEAGVTVEVAGPARGPIVGKHGYTVAVDLAFPEVDPAHYAILVLPGGKAPAAIRNDPQVQGIARAFVVAAKPVAAICHGPQILAAAGLLKGRRVTCYPSVAQELQQAGAQYEDRPVVVDGNLVTSRQPGDLPDFLREMMRLLPSR